MNTHRCNIVDYFDGMNVYYARNAIAINTDLIQESASQPNKINQTI